MSNELLDMEARIKDYVSGNLDKINLKLEALGKTSKKVSDRSEKEIKQIGIAAQQSAVGVNKLGFQFTNVHSYALIAVASLGTLAATLRKVIGDASDLNETVSKTKVIFGESSGTLLEWSENASRAFGQSKRQALDAAGTFAVFGQSAGLAGNDLLNFSTELAELTSDLASFYNTSPEDAIVAVGAALRGESEPIRRYNVLLNEMILRQQGVKLGLIETTKEALTPQQRVLAAYSEILKQSTIAQGDYARTADQFANVNRTNAALLADISAELGTAFLPVMTDLSIILRDNIIPVLGSTVTKIRELSDIINGLKENNAGEILSGMFDRLTNTLIATNPLLLPVVGALKTVREMTRKNEESIGQTSFEQGPITKQQYDESEKINQSIEDKEKAELRKLEATLKRLEEEVNAEESAIKFIDSMESDLQKEKEEVDKTLKEANIQYEQEIIDTKIALKEAEISGISDAYEQELALLDLKYEQELIKYEDNQIALAAIKEKYDLQRQQAEQRHTQQQIKDNKRLERERVNQIEGITGYTLQALDMVAASSKENSNLQKGIDIAQATANVFLGVTKAISQNRLWEIPFILGLGFAQVAQISAQKYAVGGLIRGPTGSTVFGNSMTGDNVPVLLNSGEVVSTRDDQRLLLDAIRQPNVSNDNSQSITLHINLGAGGNYDMSAAQYTVDQLTPIIGDVLIKAKNEGRLTNYESAR